MPIFQTSRELSARVEKDAQKHPNHFRRMTWWAALWLSVACVGWLALAGVNGENHIFEGGELATSHRFFENDCAQCHTTWAPLQRLVKFDFSNDVHSVTNQACLTCHPGAEHHKSQLPTHQDISCSFCHLEHIGDHDLKRLTDTTCTACHRKLDKHFLAKDHQPAPSFIREVTSFSDPDGHPEFAFRRLVRSTSEASESDVGPAHKVHSVLELVEKDGHKAWRDKGKLKFNHARHLEVLSKPDGKLDLMILDKQNRAPSDHITDGSQACQLCHKADADGRYMLAVNFEQHCHQCHKLYFDGEKEVPHESPAVVRGFLTDYFTLAALKSPEDLLLVESQRSIPGRSQRPRLTKDSVIDVTNQVTQVETDLQKLVTQAESLTERREHGVKSGCFKCHLTSPFPKKEGDPDIWSVAPTNIPARWQAHSVFNHRSHQLLNCAECHGLANSDENTNRVELPQPGVFHSKDTGDVLLPGLNLCRKCHSDTPAPRAADSAVRSVGARTGCVECHNYHDHGHQSFVGHRNPLLEPSEVQLDALWKGRSNQKP